MAIVKKRRMTKKTKSKKAIEVLLPGQKTMERSCATCRPACALCIRGAQARGLPADGVRCCYAAASFFAKEGDGEVEARLGGRGAKCEWGELKAEEVNVPSAVEAVESEVVDEHRASSSSSASSHRSLSPFSSVASTVPTSPSAASLSPIAVFRPRPLPSPPRPLTPPAASSLASSVSPSRAVTPPLPLTVLPTSTVPVLAPPTRLPTPPTTFALHPSTLFLTLPPALPTTALPLSQANSAESTLIFSTLASPLPAYDPSTYSSLPLVPTTDHFWHGGPLSDEDLRGWSGLMYLAGQCQLA
ncbi:hypothetical protein JCM11251_006773 [Rhodosporidiobolus azoricus]